MPRKSDEDSFIKEMTYRLNAPVLTWPGYEADITTEQVQRARLARLAKPPGDECADYEAGLYLMTATLANPPSHTWYKIYWHIFHKCFPEQARQLSDQFDPEPLEPWEEQQLARFKAWIFKRQMESVKADLKEAKASAEVELDSFNAGQPLAPLLTVQM